MSAKAPVITVDGASGTGKGVVTQIVAQNLNWNLLDSGALYRVLALAAEYHAIALDDASALTDLAHHLEVVFHTPEKGHTPQILLEGQDVSDAIRLEKVGNAASKVGALPTVRSALLDRQRAFREWPGLVTDGRDMGTVVFPDAKLKFFLTASPEERAGRRYKQLKEKGINVNLSDLIEELRERDQRDRERSVAPLKPANDAICIDTDKLSIEEVVERMMSAVREVFP
jgi:CMP/dCMP kinase